MARKVSPTDPQPEEHALNTLPSYIFAAFGVALVVLGLAAIFFGENLGQEIMGALVAIIGILQVIFGGLRRKTEDGTSAWSKESRSH